MGNRRILTYVLRQFALPADGLHGPEHWARVLEFAQRLAEGSQARMRVVELFAPLHDACRVSDGHDSDHGARAARLARRLRGRLIQLDDDDFRLLRRALSGHAGYQPDPGDETVRICWDAERLDLGRLGITPLPSCLYTEKARDPALIAWATGLSRAGHVPDVLRDEWGGALKSRQAAN